MDDDMSGTDATKSLLAKTLMESLPTQVFSDGYKGPTGSEIAKTKEEAEQERIFMEAIKKKLAE